MRRACSWVDMSCSCDSMDLAPEGLSGSNGYSIRTNARRVIIQVGCIFLGDENRKTRRGILVGSVVVVQAFGI